MHVTLATLRSNGVHLPHRDRGRLETRAARRAVHGQYTTSTRGLTLAEQGFIHASAAAQVAPVANAFYQGEPDLLLLVIDAGLVGPEIRY